MSEVKKTRKKKKKKSLKKDDETPKHTSSEPNSFDYGGIPDRDIKKNLGCG